VPKGRAINPHVAAIEIINTITPFCCLSNMLYGSSIDRDMIITSLVVDKQTSFLLYNFRKRVLKTILQSLLYGRPASVVGVEVVQCVAQSGLTDLFSQ